MSRGEPSDESITLMCCHVLSAAMSEHANLKRFMNTISTVAVASLIALLGACDQPSGHWQKTVSITEMSSFDKMNFQKRGLATFRFVLPTTFMDDIPGAFYRIEGSFKRSQPSLDAPAFGERVLIRATPRFSTLEGTVEATTLLPTEVPSNQVVGARLIAEGDLNRCLDAEECTRELTIDLGWLSPPANNATLDLEWAASIELRGRNSEEPPASVSALVEIQF